MDEVEKRLQKKADRAYKRRGRTPLELEGALHLFSAVLYKMLVKESKPCRFLKVLHREEHSWLAIIGSYDGFGNPIVCFGNGHSFASAMHSLGKSMVKGAWADDKYASPIE